MSTRDPDETAQLVRAVTQKVVARLGTASPHVIEAVVTEVLAAAGAGDVGPAPTRTTTPRGANLLPLAPGEVPPVDYCMSCVEQEAARGRSRAVLTTTGKNTKGIVAKVTSRIAEMGGDILDISQTLVGDYFTMIIVVDVASLDVGYARFQEDVLATVKEMGCQAMMMHEDVMASLHRV